MSNHPQTPPPPPPGANLPQGQPLGEAPAPEPRRRSWFARHKILTGILGVLAFFMIIGALGGGDDESPGVAAQTSAGSTDPAEEGTGSSAGSPGSTADGSAADEEASAEDAPSEDGTSAEKTEDAPEQAEEEAAEEEAAEEKEAVEEKEPADAKVGDVVTVGDFEVTVTGVEEGIARVGDDMFGEEAQGQFVKVLVTVQNTGDSAEYFFDSDQKLVDDQDRQHSTSSSSWLLEEESLFLAEINPGNKVEGVLLYDIPQDAVPSALELQAGWLDGTVRVSLAG